jgi:transcriptional regulator with XRE-family HTH domain
MAKQEQRETHVESENPDHQFLTNIRHLMRLNNFTEAELSRQTAIPQATLHKILSGQTTDPRISTLQIIANVFNITVDALMSGSPSNARNNPLTKIKTQSIPILSWADSIQSEKLLSTLSANNWNKWVVSEYLNEKVYALITKPSMEPFFAEGSILIIDPTLNPIDGAIVVVHYPETEEATLREFLHDGPNKSLSSINDTHQKESFSSTIKILGVVVESRLPR